MSRAHFELYGHTPDGFGVVPDFSPGPVPELPPPPELSPFEALCAVVEHRRELARAGLGAELQHPVAEREILAINTLLVEVAGFCVPHGRVRHRLPAPLPVGVLLGHKQLYPTLRDLADLLPLLREDRRRHAAGYGVRRWEAVS